MSSSATELGEKLETVIPERDRSAFKIALYNSGFLVFLVLIGVALYAVYHLLYAFLNPIIWAVLVGTVLFPFKQKVTDGIRGWLRGLISSGTPLTLGVVLLPVQGLDSAADAVWAVLATKKVFFIFGGYFAMKILTHEGVFLGVVRFASRIMGYLDTLISVFSSTWMLIPFILYVCAYAGWAYMQSSAGGNKDFGRVLSVPIWFLSLVWFSTLFGPFRVLILLGSSIIIALIAARVLSAEACQFYPQNTAAVEPEAESTEVAAPEKKETSESEEKTCDSLGDTYLKGIFAACILLWTVKHNWLLAVLMVPFLVAIVKKTGEVTGLWELICSGASSGASSVWEKSRQVVEFAVPSTIRDFFKVLFNGDKRVIEGLEEQMDVLSSVVVMIGVVLIGSLTAFFVAFQLHGELLHVVRVGSSVLSAEQGGVPGLLSGAINYSGTNISQADIDTYVEDAYQYGRTWLASQVRELADPADTDRADMLEAQVKLIVDRLYELYESGNLRGQKGTDTHPDSTSGDLWTHLQLSQLDLSRLSSELSALVSDNIGTLTAVLESVWSVLVSNVAFVSSVLLALLGLVLSFGMELLNLIIGLVVFMTMVYYLLASSTTRWKPLEWFSAAATALGPAADSTGSGSGVSQAVEDAISGVFVLSTKMSVFYGLYTWFIHRLFALNVVFLPSLLATLLAAVPLTSPCMVSVLGAVELWLVRGEAVAAVLFLFASIAPMMFVDAAFYAEVKGSHPYVTGLAIVGGIYWLGLQGAIIGPILLCCVLVLINLASSMRHQ